MESPTQETSGISGGVVSSPVDLCLICYELVHKTKEEEEENGNGLYTRELQCGASFCNGCLREHVRVQVENGVLRVECANCDGPLDEEVIETCLQGYPLLQQRYKRNEESASNDPKVKTCPNCCFPNRVEDEKTKLVQCVQCELPWCFACHAPWHEGSNCEAFKRGSALFLAWANTTTPKGSVNARACPKCGVFIQRSTGCNHMTCSRCKTPFCYQCGQKIISSQLLGDHWSRYSVLGCRFIYKRDRPVQRKMVRGGMLLAKLASLPVLAAAFISFAPFYAAYHVTKCLCRGRNQMHKVI